MHDTTERTEGTEVGIPRLVGADEDVIYSSFTELLDDSTSYNPRLMLRIHMVMVWLVKELQIYWNLDTC